MHPLLERFSHLDLTVISVSFALLIAARPISRWLDNERSSKDQLAVRISAMRILNILIIALIALRAFYLKKLDLQLIDHSINLLIVIYFSVVMNQFMHFLIERRFGRHAEIEGDKRIITTYSSQALSLLSSIAIILIALIISLQILELDSLLKAGGVVGIIGLFFAMTQGAWAPDLFNGLIILNSRLCEEGDVIQFELDGVHVARVFKTKFFHTELLDLASNHRLMIRNVNLRNCVVHNLSRFASARGLRERLLFNIGYEHDSEKVRAMFTEAFDVIDRETSVREEQHEVEVAVFETADYAVVWAVYFHIKDVKQILSFRQYVKEIILKTSKAHNISLSTPVLQSADVTMLSNS